MPPPLKIILLCVGLGISQNLIAAPDIDDVTIEVMEHTDERAEMLMERIELPGRTDDDAHDLTRHRSKSSKESRHREKGDDRDHEDDDKDEAEDHKDDVDDHKDEAEEHKDEAKEDAEDQKEDAEDDKEEAEEHKEEDKEDQEDNTAN